MSEDNSIDDALREALAEPKVPGEHPQPAELAAYRHRTLSPEAVDAIREHLARCRRCGDLLIDLIRFEGAEDAPEEQEGLADESAWLRLRKAAGLGLGVEEGAERSSTHSVRIAALGSVRAGEKGRHLHPPARYGYALAAGLLLACVGLGIWVQALRGDLARLREPSLNPAIINLVPPGFERSGEDGSREIAADSKRVVLLLNPPQEPHRREYGVAIVDASGRTYWEGWGLRPTSAGNFQMEIASGFLVPGEYRLLLRARGEEGVVATYVVRVR